MAARLGSWIMLSVISTLSSPDTARLTATLTREHFPGEKQKARRVAVDPPRSLIRIAPGGWFSAQSTITVTKVQKCLAAIPLYLYLGTARSVVPDLKANQTDEGQPPEDEPAQSSDHYDKK
jgi:hypothetical protein